MKKYLGLLIVALACVFLVAACGSKKKSTTTATSTSSTTTTTVPVAPLTGLPQPDAALRSRPVLAIKVDNHPEARPQFGIDKADDIIEERVEGGLTRFMALFQSQDSNQVGPVRSLRNTDVNWLQSQGGMIAYSGGIPQVEALLKPAGIVDLGADTHGSTYYKRRSDRPYEHSMYTITPALRSLTPANMPAPKPLFQYLPAGQKFNGAGIAPLAGITVHIGSGASDTVIDWAWDPNSGQFLRSTDGKVHNIEGVGQIAMKNVIVQYTNYSSTPWRDAANNPVDQADVVGSGDAWIMSDGQIVKGHWSRPTASDITSYTDANGAPIELQPGHTWVTLAPIGAATATR